MTIHEMMHQVALLSGSIYTKQDEVSRVEININDERTQVLYARYEEFNGDQVGLFYAEVGPLTKGCDYPAMLEINAQLRYSRVALLDGKTIALLATIELDRTSVKECAPILQEIGAVADELEKILYGTDDA